MDKDIKKKLTRNWFINLQEMICNAIQQIEGRKIKFLKVVGDALETLVGVQMAKK